MWESDWVGSTAVNNDATDITENSAILKASVQPNSENINVFFIYGLVTLQVRQIIKLSNLIQVIFFPALNGPP